MDDPVASAPVAGVRVTRNRALLAAVVAALLVCGGLLGYGAGRGADLTDEIFYLIWARDPDAYALIYQPFGYLLGPLFALVHGDLRSYRLAGFVVAAGAGALLGASLPAARRDVMTFALYGALAALTIFFPWIVTPSYNSAANVGAMLAIAGVVNILAGRPGRRVVGVVAAGAGLCLAAFAKPPLFAVAVAAIVLLALRTDRRAAAALIAALALAAASTALFLAPAAMPGLVARMAASQHVLALPNTPLSLPAKVARDWLAVPLSLGVAAVAAGLALVFRRSGRPRWPGVLAVAASILYVVGIAADAIDGALPDFVGLSLVTAVAGYASLLGRRDADRLVTAPLLAAPFAVALGTFNNQWAQLNFSMAFPFLALFALAAGDPLHWRRSMAQALAVIGPVGVLLLAALHPYSLPASIFEQQVAIAHPLTGSRILVDSETAAFVRSARGLAPGALLVDLSGTGPGVAAALGARAPVLPWLNPATATWPDVVWSRLSPGERDGAWFVGPVWPAFRRSAPARWLVAHQARLCRRELPPLPFWGEERTLEIWRPCRTVAAASSGGREVAAPIATAGKTGHEVPTRGPGR